MSKMTDPSAAVLPGPEGGTGVQKRRSARPPHLAKAELAYARSRMRSMQLPATSLTLIPLSLDASTIKVGVSNRRSRDKLDIFRDVTQTTSILYDQSTIQIPEIETK
jgi:hypothetical protein